MGCDYCGDVKNEPIKAWKGAFNGNWKHIFLHYPTCWLKMTLKYRYS